MHRFDSASSALVRALMVWFQPPSCEASVISKLTRRKQHGRDGDV